LCSTPKFRGEKRRREKSDALKERKSKAKEEKGLHLQQK
jgi:hypothetical protein